MLTCIQEVSEMGTTMLRVDDRTAAVFRELAQKDGASIRQVTAEAAEDLRRKRFMEEFNAAYARLQADPEAWAEELEERELYENTLMDGLEDA
jgi:hypothetical protein